MAHVNNPRFPHHCRIIRYPATEPMEDQGNVDDPMSDEENELPDFNADFYDDFDIDSVSPEKVKVIYEGVCRSDNRDTISDNGDVIASYRTLSLPLRQQEWTEETIPQEGDKIELQRFGYKEYGMVIDRRPSNLGTHILWKYVRN